MKLKNLKSVGHNTAHSYLSTLGHIDGMYASTYLHRLALKNGLSIIKLDVLNASISGLALDDDAKNSLQELRTQFTELLRKEGIPFEAIKAYKLSIKLLGNRIDIVDIQCTPLLIDWNDKAYNCASVREKYPAPV